MKGGNKMDKFCEDCIHNSVCQYGAIPPHKDWCSDKDTYESIDEFLNGTKEGEWIPVSERLPEVWKKVLVSDVFGVYIGEFIDAEETWGGKHFINEHGMQSKSVVAWMPLPEPYKKGGTE